MLSFNLDSRITMYSICFLCLCPWLTAWFLFTHISIWKRTKIQLETVSFSSQVILFHTASVLWINPTQWQPDSPIQLPRMVEKIFLLLASSISLRDRKLKWRVKRWVMGFRPPPGGPIAQAKLMSTICLNVPMKKDRKTKEAKSYKMSCLTFLNENWKNPYLCIKTVTYFRQEETCQRNLLLAQ